LTSSAIGRCVRLATGAAVVAIILGALPAAAQEISINLGQGAGAAGSGGLTERVIQLIAFITVLSLAPSILVMMTSFTRIVVVLSLLRTALGTATSPPNSVVISLALFLTAFVMGPVLTRVYDVGVSRSSPTRSASTRPSTAPADHCAVSWRRTSAKRICGCS
jgi:flagellar biosynthetic protein FliP